MGLKKKRNYLKQTVFVILFSSVLINQLCLASETIKNGTNSDGKIKGETTGGSLSDGDGKVRGRSVSSLLRNWDPVGKFQLIF